MRLAGDGLVAEGVAHAPGGPVHVLLSDEIAEHIPGCNMAFRSERLRAIGGFDSALGWRETMSISAGVCRSAAGLWDLAQQRWSGTIDENLSALTGSNRRVMHVRRHCWPINGRNNYNGAGHLKWSGRLYGKGMVDFFLSRSKVYHGTWGSALFQSVYEPARGVLMSLPLMPEWYFVVAVLGALAALGLAWSPLLLVVPLFMLAVAASLIQAGIAAMQSRRLTPARFSNDGPADVDRLASPYPATSKAAWTRTLWGRALALAGLLSRPVRLRQTHVIWSEEWQPTETRLAEIERLLLRKREAVKRGGDFDRWDLEVRGGLLGYVRAVGMIEEHGAGKQLFRLRAWPHIPRPVIVLACHPGFTCRSRRSRPGLACRSCTRSLGRLDLRLRLGLNAARAVRIWCDALSEYASAKSKVRSLSGTAESVS